MSSPAAKKQRIIQSASTLSRPFRSPLEATSANFAVTTDPVAELVEHQLTEQIPTALPSKTRSQLHAAQQRQPPLLSEAQLRADPTVLPLVKAQRDLERQLKETQQELDAVEQARKIEAESQQFSSLQKNSKEDTVIDGELIELIEKWKACARLAAEELFGPVKDKINRAGGPQAWRDSQAASAQFLQSLNEQPPFDPESEDHPAPDEVSRDIYAEYGVDPETENEKEARGGNDVCDAPDDEFTMLSMLNMLGLNPGILGYDSAAQRWSD